MTRLRGFGEAFEQALALLQAGFESLPVRCDDTTREAGRAADAALEAVAIGALLEAAERLQDNYPYHHPLYVGQMLKPPHPLARHAYALAQLLNPNNHALDGGRASSRMEKEAVAEIAAMIGWQTHLGHLCGGGTLANFEALWIGREEWGAREAPAAAAPTGAVVASTAAHYTHQRLSAVLGVPFEAVATDAAGRMSPAALREVLDRRPVATVVATLGSTAIGAVDPVDELLSLRERYGFRLHVDGAYGGYFGLVEDSRAGGGGLSDAARAAFEAVAAADSFVVDPHKHGLQPYGCGCILFRDPAVGRHYRHDSPYTYFSSDDLHLGEISLECSRAGAAAVALWTTQRALPLLPGGEFAQMLEACLRAARELHAHLRDHPHLAPVQAPALDIVVAAVRADGAQRSSALARAVFEEAAARDLHLAVVELPRALCEPAGVVAHWDAPALTCLRACTMKPEHQRWLGQITGRLDAAAAAVMRGDQPRQA